MAENDTTSAVRVNQNCKVAAWTAKQLKLAVLALQFDLSRTT